MNHDYNEESIERFGDIDHVRLRPSLYVGSSDLEGVHHLFKEIFANALDEHLAGYGNRIEVQIRESQIAVRDYGRGIPFGIHSEGFSALTLVATSLKAGGKFNESVYKTSAGLHGMGLSVVNALSSVMMIKSFRDGVVATQIFKQGIPVSEVIIEKTKRENGTLVVYKPDVEIFEGIIQPSEWIVRDLYFAACLNSIKIELDIDGQELILNDLEPATLIEKTSGHEPIQVPWITSQNIYLRFAFALSRDPKGIFFVNGVPVLKGNFITMFYERFAKQLNESDLDFAPEDLVNSLNTVIAVKAPVSMIDFRGQTKDACNIKSSDLTKLYDAILTIIWQSRGFKTLLTKHYKPFLQAVHKQRASQKELKTAIKELDDSSVGNFLLPGKLADCQIKWAGELYLVEGESASGSSKQARDRKFQAILPLKGKILNTLKAGIKESLACEVVKDLFQSLGVDITDKGLITVTPRYSKIIIATDPDTDGNHIRCLLLTFFLQWLRPLVENGYIWIANSPLYRIQDKKGKIQYAYTDQELNTLVKASSLVTRFKGLGEMNANELRDAIFNPETRQLKRVDIGNLEEAATVMYSLLGPGSDTRTDFLSLYAAQLEELGHDFSSMI